MSDYAPPTGPPPPKAPEVPAGWAARWNDQYKEWFYVNIYTKKSQWDKPTSPVFPDGDAPPSGPPPGYDGHNAPRTSDAKTNPYGDQSNNFGGSPSRQTQEDEDARLAAKMQAEENARARSASSNPPGYNNYSGGAADSYRQQSTSPYPPPQSSPYGTPQPQQQQGESRGLLGKLTSKIAGKSPGGFPGAPGAGSYGGYGPPQQQYGAPPAPYGQAPSPYGGAPAAYGGGYAPGYGAPPPAPYGQPAYGYQQPQQQPAKKSGGGLGLAGGAALGLAGGVVGGLLIDDAIDHFEDEGYERGYDQGYDNGFDNGYDDGGGDF